MNFFSPKSAAQRYSKGRPYSHPIVIERIKKFLSLDEPLSRAIDVGCGTGLSTIALKEIATEIVGLDASFEMVALAPRDARIAYLIASGDQLPFTEGVFDLMTLSQSFHWLDREKFFKEACRTLRAGGRMVVYDNYFLGRMEENAEFHEWFKENYPRRFPAPKRGRLAFEPEDLEGTGFQLLGHERFPNSTRFTLTALVDYLTTHSNVIAAVEYGADDINEVRRWLAENIKPFYGDFEEVGFIFDGLIWYLENAA
jgi:ubiquinone/menaquinone biosynthesis C-methylase UbiE